MVKIQPEYPREALKAGKTGFVIIRLTVDERGNVLNLEVVDSKPGGIFIASAVRAVRKWKFKPRVINGDPVMQVGEVTIEFTQ